MAGVGMGVWALISFGLVNGATAGLRRSLCGEMEVDVPRERMLQPGAQPTDNGAVDVMEIVWVTLLSKVAMGDQAARHARTLTRETRLENSARKQREK